MDEVLRRIGHADGPFAVQTQGYNIRRYSDYLIARARAFESTKVDHVRNGQGRMRKLTVEKGLLRETEIVQKQIRALLRCDVGSLDNRLLPSLTSRAAADG